MIDNAIDGSHSVSAAEQGLGHTPAIVTGLRDALLLAAEWSLRQVYWRSTWLRTWVKQRRTKQPVKPQVAEKQALIAYLRKIGVSPGSLVMAHTSTTGLSLDGRDASASQPGHSLQMAQELLTVLQELIGETGTLVMPTHPIYKPRAAAADSPDNENLPIYNPRSTPCGVGLTNELFWRQHGTERSLFPHNSLAAKGPLATELLRDHLNDSKPLAHGKNSGYHRFCQRNGLLVSIGVPLGNCFTLVHAAEEVLDEQWPVTNFFEDSRYIVRQAGIDQTVTIRKTRVEFMKFSLCIRKLRRDLVRAGILHEGSVGTVRVDWAQAGEIFDFLSRRNRSSTYPYFGTSLVSRKERDLVANT